MWREDVRRDRRSTALFRSAQSIECALDLTNGLSRRSLCSYTVVLRLKVVVHQSLQVSGLCLESLQKSLVGLLDFGCSRSCYGSFVSSEKREDGSEQYRCHEEEKTEQKNDEVGFGTTREIYLLKPVEQSTHLGYLLWFRS